MVAEGYIGRRVAVRKKVSARKQWVSSRVAHVYDRMKHYYLVALEYKRLVNARKCMLLAISPSAVWESSHSLVLQW